MLKLLFVCLVSLLPSVRAVFSPDTKRQLVEALQECIGACTANQFSKLGSTDFDFHYCHQDPVGQPWSTGSGVCPIFSASPDGKGGTNGAIGEWDVSKITNMYSLLYGAFKFNQDISNWNVRFFFLYVYSFCLSFNMFFCCCSSYLFYRYKMSYRFVRCLDLPRNLIRISKTGLQDLPRTWQKCLLALKNSTVISVVGM